MGKGTSGGDTADAVSYTHLDVYKRQVLGFEGIAFETDGHAPITCLCKNVQTIRPACLFYTRSLIQELHDLSLIHI